MSEATEAIWACVTDEWISTAEIVERVQMNGDRLCRTSKVHRQLAQGVKYGLVEKRVLTGGRGGRTAEWRRKARCWSFLKST